jgi:hypothetical protein
MHATGKTAGEARATGKEFGQQTNGFILSVGRKAKTSKRDKRASHKNACIPVRPFGQCLHRMMAALSVVLPTSEFKGSAILPYARFRIIKAASLIATGEMVWGPLNE